ncbi:MAG: hexitol phosphatase HxpB [Acidimicrobiales bacterium]
MDAVADLVAVVFDMDGVLLDSEPLWQDAEIEVFGALGLALSREDCRETMGMRVDEVVARRHAEHPWTGPGREEVAGAVVARVIALVRDRGTPLPGVGAALDLFGGRGLRLALASSSSYALIDAVLEALHLRGRFEVVHSADDEAAGKPDPAVYLGTARKLGADPGRCLAVEDSLAGVRAARAAGMRCLAVPDPAVAGTDGFGAADVVLASLVDLDDGVCAALGCG